MRRILFLKFLLQTHWLLKAYQFVFADTVEAENEFTVGFSASDEVVKVFCFFALVAVVKPEVVRSLSVFALWPHAFLRNLIKKIYCLANLSWGSMDFLFVRNFTLREFSGNFRDMTLALLLEPIAFFLIFGLVDHRYLVMTFLLFLMAFFFWKSGNLIFTNFSLRSQRLSLRFFFFINIVYLHYFQWNLNLLLKHSN